MYYQNPKSGVESHRMLISHLPPIYPLVYKTLSIRFSEATIGIVDRVLQTQFRLAYAHIWYGNSNTVYSEGVRAVTTYPPLLTVTSYITHRTEYRGMHPLFNKKLCGVYYILCVLWYAYYQDAQSIDIPTIMYL